MDAKALKPTGIVCRANSRGEVLSHERWCSCLDRFYALKFMQHMILIISYFR